MLSDKYRAISIAKLQALPSFTMSPLQILKTMIILSYTELKRLTCKLPGLRSALSTKLINKLMND